jgi:hypothetical protein
MPPLILFSVDPRLTSELYAALRNGLDGTVSIWSPTSLREYSLTLFEFPGIMPFHVSSHVRPFGICVMASSPLPQKSICCSWDVSVIYVLWDSRQRSSVPVCIHAILWFAESTSPAAHSNGVPAFWNWLNRLVYPTIGVGSPTTSDILKRFIISKFMNCTCWLFIALIYLFISLDSTSKNPHSFGVSIYLHTSLWVEPFTHPPSKMATSLSAYASLFKFAVSSWHSSIFWLFSSK